MQGIATATANIIGDEAQVHPQDADAAKAELLVGAGAGAGVGVVARDIGSGIEDDHLRGVRLRLQGIIVDATHIRRRLAVLGDPGRKHLPLGGTHEATVLCPHLQGAAHLLPAVIAAVRCVAIAGRVHRQGPLQDHVLLQGNAAVPPPLIPRCQ